MSFLLACLFNRTRYAIISRFHELCTSCCHCQRKNKWHNDSIPYSYIWVTEIHVGMINNNSIYIVGFPKSGTVWLTRLICDGMQAPRASGMPGDEEKVKRTNAMLSLDEAAVPAIRHTHLLPHDLANYRNEECVLGIYIYRDLRDVLISGFMHKHSTEHEVLLTRRDETSLREALTDPWVVLKRKYWRHISRRSFGRFATLMCQEGWHPFGTWGEHIKQWRAHAAANTRSRIAFISYEELSNDTLRTLKKAIGVLGIEIPVHEQLVTVVERYSAERLLKARLSHDAVDRPLDAYAPGTLRKAIVGDYRNYMRRAEACLVENTNGKMLRDLGYVDNGNWINELLYEHDRLKAPQRQN